MNVEELLKKTPGELTDLGICPTCFNRAHGGVLYGDTSRTLFSRTRRILLRCEKNARVREMIAAYAKENET